MSLDKITENLKGMLIFEISGKTYCINIKYVPFIINPSDTNVTIIECKDGHSQLQFGKNIFKIIDVCKIFNIDKKETSGSTRIITIEIFNKKLAFFVDRIIEALTLTEKEIEQKLKFNRTIEDGYISGNIEYGNHRFILPNYTKLIDNFSDLSG